MVKIITAFAPWINKAITMPYAGVDRISGGWFCKYMFDTDISHLLLVRHGESEGNANPEIYLRKGDSKLGLTERGWHQLKGTGRFLGAYCPEVGMTKWPLIQVSTHQRTLESLTGLLFGMGSVFEGDPKINPQAFLTEKFFGAASALEFIEDEKVPREFRDHILHLSKAVNAHDPFSAKHLFGESTKDTMIAAKLLMDGTISRDIQEGHRKQIIVCHGAVIQAMIMNLLHVLPKDKNKIGNPGNGDVIEIIGSRKNWTCKRIWDGEKGERISEDYKAKIHRFTVADLPPVPDFLKNGI